MLRLNFIFKRNVKNNKHIFKRRNLTFSSHTKTKIWKEYPSLSNPYLTEKCLCHGYNLIELLKKRSYIDVIFLLFNGELPSAEQSDLLEKLMLAFINPGPRHPAVRASINASIGRTNLAHILPISLSVLSGNHLAANEVADSMKFLRRNFNKNPNTVAIEKLDSNFVQHDGDWHIAPGFGTRFGEKDPMPNEIANIFLDHPASGSALKWGEEFIKSLENCSVGWLTTGVVAATLCDLGFHSRLGAGIFQIISAPGMLAHGIEMSNKPITEMPFLDAQHYIIIDQANEK